MKSQTSELLDQAKVFADQLKWSEAADSCFQALKIEPQNNEVKGELGWYLSRSKRYDEAIKLFQELMQAEPEHAKWPYMLGYQYYDQQNWREATNWFGRALELREDYLIVLYRKGYAHTQLGETHEAQALFVKCVNLWREITDIERQQRESKTYSDACLQLGKMLLERGQAERAINAFAEAVKYDQMDAHKHYNLGKAYFEAGKYDNAMQHFLEADRCEPHKDYIQYYIARTFTAQGDYVQAEKAYNRIPAKRRKAYIWQYMGEMYLAWEQREKALEALQTAVRLEKKNHNAFYLLGRAYEGCNQIADAYAAYKRAVALRQENYEKDFPDAQERVAALEKQAEQSGVGLNTPTLTNTPRIDCIEYFHAEKKYGFITRGSEPNLFFHISNVRNPESIRLGAHVSYEVGQGKKGPEAFEVVVNE